MILTEASQVLARCEADLRVLVTAAADCGDYDAVLRITSWAKQIASMSRSVQVVVPAEKTATKKLKKAVVRPTYPRFLRRGDALVKIGWSKREKNEYEHKAPRQTVLLLARVIADIGMDGRIFQIDALTPLIDPKDGTQIPNYQIYLIIAWWRSAGLLDQHGRQGYSIPNANQLLQAVESAWTKLLEK